LSAELYIYERHREAAEKLALIVALPLPEDEWGIGNEGVFDPWEPFPLYGTYGGDFDACAIDVLEELLAGHKKRDDLGAEMFREMLCSLDLCEYGTSPRVCFPTTEFRALLPEYIRKWRAYSLLHWGEDVTLPLPPGEKE